MVDLGLPDFGPGPEQRVVQRDSPAPRAGIHAEPWDKLVSVATGRIFGAWVDSAGTARRSGPWSRSSSGPGRASSCPVGSANAFQTLEDGTAYSYLVNDHWSAEAKDSYTFVNLADETLAIDWPIPLDSAELSDADRAHPRLARRGADAGRKRTVDRRRQRAARTCARGAAPGRRVSRTGPRRPDRSRQPSPRSTGGPYDVVINAAALHRGRRGRDARGPPRGLGGQRGGRPSPGRTRPASTGSPWSTSPRTTSSTAPSRLHDEDEPFSPLGVYGQTKAAGDALVSHVGRRTTSCARAG